MLTADFLQKNIDVGAALSLVHVEDSLRPYVVRPNTFELEAVPDAMLKKPFRLQQSVSVFDAASFIAYFTDYCNPDSRVFVDVQTPNIVGVIDYHKQEDCAPEWTDHRVVFRFRPTPEWIVWSGSNRKSMTQTDFARFVEDNLPDITRPAGADMLEISRTMEAKKNVSFSSGVRLQNGETQLQYEEEIKGTAAKGTLEIPETFDLAISPFEGSEVYKVMARLRYQIKDSALTMRYELIRPHKIMEDALQAIVRKIQGGVNNPITFGHI